MTTTLKPAIHLVNRAASALLLPLLLCTCGPATSTEESTVITAPTEAPAPDTGPNYTFASGDHFGDINKSMTPEELLNTYGAEVTAATLYGPEGITYAGYKLYPGTPAEAEFTHFEDEPLVFTIKQPASPWTGMDGRLRIGMSLAELVALNGQPITFFGLGWDYGGYVMNYNGGTLRDYTIRLDATAGENFPASLSGDQEISTQGIQSLAEVPVAVSSISVSLE